MTSICCRIANANIQRGQIANSTEHVEEGCYIVQVFSFFQFNSKIFYLTSQYPPLAGPIRSMMPSAFLLLGINRFSYKSKDRVRNEKVYVVDTAFVTEREDNFSLENLGWKLENIVCIELMRRYKPLFCDVFYYKESTSQVDFVIAKDGNVQELIQVSFDISTEKTRNREIRGLKNAAQKLKCRNLTLVTFEEDVTIEEDGYTINIVPATKWLIGSIK